MNRIERLEKVLNKTSGNPYHDSEGKFTFSHSSFKNTSGKDAEVTDNPRDWYLTDLSRKNINKVPEISSTKELKDYLSPNGNSISKNEDGSYQLILKVEKDKTSKNSLKMIDYLRNNLSAKSYFRSQRLSAILNKVNKGNPYHDKLGRFSSGSSSSYYYRSDTTLGDKTKSGNITKEIKSFKDFKDNLSEVIETYNSYDIKGQEVWIHPASKLFKNIYSPVTDENTLKLRKDEIEKENKSPFVLVSTYNDEDVIIDGNHVAAAYKELSEEGKNYLVPVLYVKKEEIERFEKEHSDYHYKEKTYTKTKLINE